MQYQGGKWNLRKDISKIIELFNYSHIDGYIEPFVGGGSVLSEICKWFPKPIFASDFNYDLILFWQAIMSGWLPPEKFELDETIYYNMFDAPPSPMKTFILFGCSFGGGWKNTFARDKRKKISFYETSRNSLNKKLSTIKTKNIKFEHCSYFDIENVNNKIIYCDPPYLGTNGYKAVGKFDHNQFHNWCRNISKNNILIISEYFMPDDFECIFEKEKHNHLQAQTGNQDIKIERIFIHKEGMM